MGGMAQGQGYSDRAAARQKMLYGKVDTSKMPYENKQQAASTKAAALERSRMDTMAKRAGMDLSANNGRGERVGAYRAGYTWDEVNKAYAASQVGAAPPPPADSEAYFKALSRIQTDRMMRESRGSLRTGAKRGSLL